MKKVIINENQRGLLFKNGKYVKMLPAGKYFSYGGKEIEVLNLDQPIISDKCALDIILSDKMVANNVSVIEVADEELALHFVNGKRDYAPRGGCIYQILAEYRKTDG